MTPFALKPAHDRVFEFCLPFRLCPEWSAGADGRLTLGSAQPLNSNNNVRGDMPFDVPFGERLQRSSQLAVFLLGPQRCRERARHFFATFEGRKVSHSIMRLQRSRQVE
jgi:hypothetical protein